MRKLGWSPERGVERYETRTTVQMEPTPHAPKVRQMPPYALTRGDLLFSVLDPGLYIRGVRFEERLRELSSVTWVPCPSGGRGAMHVPA